MSPATRVHRAATGVFALFALGVVFLPVRLAGDWRVATEGEVIETIGPWEVWRGGVVFHPAGRAETSIRATEIDLPASPASTHVLSGAPPAPTGASETHWTGGPRSSCEPALGPLSGRPGWLPAG